MRGGELHLLHRALVRATGCKLLLDVNEIGLPCATEFLDLISPQYIADLVSWGAIGARTTESQSHRQLASGLSCPVGFKNGTDGNVRIAVDAIKAANSRHHFISVTKSGHVAVFKTAGNEDCHVILRGGKAPNYDAASIEGACRDLAAAGLRQHVMVDFSHANSSKQYQKQVEVGADVARQLAAGERRVAGVMIESHINPGRQDLVPIAYFRPHPLRALRQHVHLMGGKPDQGSGIVGDVGLVEGEAHFCSS